MRWMRLRKKSCYARLFDLLRNSPLSSIHIHFGGELLVLPALVTSASLPKNEFFDRLRRRVTGACNKEEENERVYYSASRNSTGSTYAPLQLTLKCTWSPMAVSSKAVQPTVPMA